MCSFIDSIRQLIADVCSAFLKNLRFHFILNFAGAGSSGLLESASVNIVVHALFVLIVQQQCCRGLLREACPQSCHDSLFVPVFYFIKCIFMVLKMQILYLKLQTKDHFWSPTHYEVVLLYYIYIYIIYYYIVIWQQGQNYPVCYKNTLIFFLLIMFCCLAGFQSNWVAEGAAGSAERHGSHASVPARR